MPEQNTGPSILTLDLAAPPTPQPAAGGSPPPAYQLTTYIPQKQHDYVRMVVTVGLLVMLAWIIVWASIESRSWPDHWEHTKDMLQIILPALTGLIGSVIGFYFGSGVNANAESKPLPPPTP